MPRPLDRFGMASLLENFPRQIEEAVRIGEEFQVPRSLGGDLRKIVFVGMGGSAIGGDVIRSLLAKESNVPIWVSRHYELPPFVDSKTLCVFSSYSGNTEETLAALGEGLKRPVKKVIITSGGELGRLARRHSIPWIEIPKGLPPRAALGYSVFPILKLFSRLKLCRWDSRGVEETISLLGRLAREKYGPAVSPQKNPARRLARILSGRFVAIYSGTELLDSAALRFRNQIEENAKAIASHHLLPEMDHNEILGWQFPAAIVRRSASLFLTDREDHARIQLRVKITKDLIRRQGVPVEEIPSQGKSRLARLFSVIFLGDWVSYYLALLYRIDPTPVAVIESLKKRLASVKF